MISPSAIRGLVVSLIHEILSAPHKIGGRVKFYSPMRGFVEDVVDPQQRGRVRVWIPGVDTDKTPTGALPWADRLSSVASDGAGMFVPVSAGSRSATGAHTGDAVLVMFMQGDINHRVVLGLWYAKGPQGTLVPPPAVNARGGHRRRAVFKTRHGTSLEVGDEVGQTEAKVLFPSGTIIHAREAAGGSGVHINTARGHRVSVQDEHPGSAVNVPQSQFDQTPDIAHGVGVPPGQDAPPGTYAPPTLRTIPPDPASQASGTVVSPTPGAARGFGQQGILVETAQGHKVEMRDITNAGVLVRTAGGHYVELLDSGTITISTSGGGEKVVLKQGGGIDILCPGNPLTIRASAVTMDQA